MTEYRLHQNSPEQSTKTLSYALIVAAVICSMLTAWFAAEYLVAVQTTCDIAANDRINPNTANIAGLTRLPNIGVKRAADIVEYRQEMTFEKPQDMENIKGIGPKTVEGLKPYLAFGPRITPTNE